MSSENKQYPPSVKDHRHHVTLTRSNTPDATYFFDEMDFRHHADYIHHNPMKHGLCNRVAEWPYSTFHRYVAQGVYPIDWAGGDDSIVMAGE